MVLQQAPHPFHFLYPSKKGALLSLHYALLIAYRLGTAYGKKNIVSVPSHYHGETSNTYVVLSQTAQ